MASRPAPAIVQSLRNASIGSTRVARRAGSQQATKAAAASKNAVAKNAKGLPTVVDQK